MDCDAPVRIEITQTMIDAATELIPQTAIDRTSVSEIDTLTGNLGEFVFAEFWLGDWQKHRVGKNKGQTDFEGIEVKTSAHPFNEFLHLFVREDYAAARKPEAYVQIVIDVPNRKAQHIDPGTPAYICGFATAQEVDSAPKRDPGSKRGGSAGYLCHAIPIRELHPMSDLPISKPSSSL